MTTTAEPLDAATLPLAGVRLIEASAGTGKTWTIAALFVRLVLGHGVPRPYAPGEILVMTFTRAATRELSDRIRRRLAEAAAALRGGGAADDFVEAVVADLAAGDDATARAEAAHRLALAADAMDDAAVQTIDAWCQRMLREHALDSGSRLDEELQPDASALVDAAVRDYWRREVYPLAGTALDRVLAVWRDADAVAAAVQQRWQRAVQRGDAALRGDDAAGGGAAGEALADVVARAETGAAALKYGWGDRARALRAALQAAVAARQFDKRFVGAGCFDALDAVAAWADDPTAEGFAISAAARRRLTPDGLRDALCRGASVDLPADVAAFADLVAAVEARPPLASALAAHAAARVAAAVQRAKAAAGVFGYDDVLDRLDAALDAARHGDAARRLRERIVAQTPLVLVDEFQDTSPVQARILERLYGSGAAVAPPGRALLLIGDPKQSIYAFRGADIASYLRLARATAGRHHALATNHRSSAALVGAVNGVFGAAEARPGSGAFDYRDALEASDELPFVAVAAKGLAERFVAGGADAPALQCCVDATLRNAPASHGVLAAVAAERIVGWLDDAGTGFVDAHGALRRVRAADIAVLVRTGAQAGVMRRALQARGVASVYLSDRDSVLATDEAADLLRLLQAVAAPRDVRRVRAALATGLVGRSLAELTALADDAALFDTHAAQFAHWRDVWREHGVLAMLRRAAHALALPARWLAADTGDGERRLTNLLHLAELLQAESERSDGEAALLRWFAGSIDAAARYAAGGIAPEEQLLRLESDAGVVQVVTVHAAKGLQYPLVLLPFAASVRTEGEKTDDGRPDADADRSRRREERRLLYVALTRAQHAVWIGLGALKVGNGRDCVWHKSAIGGLISGDAPRTPPQLAADVAALAAAVPGVAIVAAPPVDAADVPLTRLAARADRPPLAAPLRYTARFDRSWGVASYSALVRELGAADGATAARPLRDDEPVDGEDRGAADGEGLAAAHGATVAVDASDAAAFDDHRSDVRSDAGAEPDGDLDDDPRGDADAELADDMAGRAVDRRGNAAHRAVAAHAGPAVAVFAAAAPPDAAPWHRFPRGAQPGTFLHEQLQWLADEHGLARLASSPALQDTLRRRCERAGHGARADDVLAWLQRLCTTPLAALGAPPVALAQLDRPIAEMEFWLPSRGVDTAAVDALCRRHLLPGRPRPALPARTLHGMLTGYVDLVYANGGAYGVVDFKSTALGPGDADYTAGAMQRAALAQRYDVQAALYLVALHRLLRTRLEASADDATPRLHGAVVWFVRGVAADGGGALHLAAPPTLVAALDAMFAPPQPAFGKAAPVDER